MQIGAVVAAAGLSSRMKAFKPMLELAGSTVIRETIAALHDAGVDDIAVVVGYRGEELAKHLAEQGVRIIQNLDYATGDMFRSVCMGLSAMGRDKDALLFLPADIPLFSAETARRLCDSMEESPCNFISPVYQGQRGHPILLNGSVVKDLLTFSGEGGLREAMTACGGEHRLVEVNDRGILLDADRPQDYEQLQRYAAALAQRETITFRVTTELMREVPFWNQQLCGLLQSVDSTGSLNKSCEQMGLSYSKGWGAIKQAQYRLGVPLLLTSAGGVGGGGSTVTPEARQIMDAYNAMHRELNDCANGLFHKHFGELFGNGK